MPQKDLTLGARFKHIFAAFLVSTFVPVLQAWLGTEYSKLSNDLGKLGDQTGSGDASKAAPLFKMASRLTFTLFAGVIVYMVLYAVSMVYYNYALTPIVVILIAILACAINIILRKAWNNLSRFFMAKEAISSSMPAPTERIARVITGVSRCIASAVIMTIGFMALIPLIPYINNPANIVQAYHNFLYFLVYFLSLGFSFLIGLILGLVGIINQATGIYGLSKVLQDGVTFQNEGIG